MTFVSVTLGSLVGSASRPFSWALYAATLAGMTLAHAAANVVNDCFDTRYGIDTADSPTARYRRQPLVERLATERQMLTAATAIYGVAVAVGIVLVAVRGWPVLALALLGLAAGVTYSGGPFRYKPRALGELSVFLMWGPLAVGGSAFVQSGSLSVLPAAVLVSLPQGTWVALVIFANNMKDAGYDGARGVRTLANLLGPARSRIAFAATLAAAYLVLLAAVAARALSPWGLLVLLSLPVSARLTERLCGRAVAPADSDPQAAAAVLLSGLLLIGALLVDRFTQAAGA